jgi:tetrahydromethanopterin S-methyltransferase subunit F
MRTRAGINYRPRRRRTKAGSDALAIAGFVCGLVGLVLLCVPVVSMILSVLGIVFGACGMGSRNNGLATAGLVCGIITIGIAIIVIVAVAHRW